MALIVLMAPSTSLAVHEWLGLAMIPVAMIHLLFAWQWIVTSLSRLVGKSVWRLRINVLLNTLLFVAFVLVMFSGVMASAVVLPSLGLTLSGGINWQGTHNQWANYFLLLAGLHLAMNWSWINGTVRRLVFRRPTARGDVAIAALSAETDER